MRNNPICTALELINVICPEHNRTSCSDEHLTNGFGSGHDYKMVAVRRCERCSLLQLIDDRYSPDFGTEEEILASYKDE